MSDTPDMLAFFETKAGVPYAGERYTQVLVARTAGQEASGFAMLSDAYGKALLDSPPPLNLSAHEVAHQWWGNLVTCREWTHFWLHEGFATFMAAAYDEHRFGREAYLRDIENARMRYEQVRDASGDRSLVFPSWDRPTAADRTIVYQKGAYVLHQLRELLGDRVFWQGIQRYTRSHAGRSVTTVDFQRSMEQSSGQDLASFFAKWVYLR
jgi:aminopeptidase N